MPQTPKAVINPADFTTRIDNPLFPLRPGTTFTYADQAAGVIDHFTVTRRTQVIDGVTCVVVHDKSFVNGKLEENTFDWFAEDKKGNVWYFGEDTTHFNPNGTVSHAGTWKAGVNGATPGIIMEAHPKVGDHYKQEHATGVAEDQARVLKLDDTVTSQYGSFDHVLKTKEFSRLDPPADFENKWYVPGIGTVLTTDSHGEHEELVKIAVNGTDKADALRGYAGGDHLNGLRGADKLAGLAGDDTISGGMGNDTLIGGIGDDVLKGGAGADHFVFNLGPATGTATDKIVDYHQAAGDTIDLPNGAMSVDHDALVNGTWELTLTGGHEVIKLVGVMDTNSDGHIVDNLTFG